MLTKEELVVGHIYEVLSHDDTVVKQVVLLELGRNLASLGYVKVQEANSPEPQGQDWFFAKISRLRNHDPSGNPGIDSWTARSGNKIRQQNQAPETH